MRRHLKIKVGFGLVAITASALAQNAVTSVAGGGSTTVAARAASIGTPSGMARDASGNLYIADSALNRVYKVTSAGTLSIVAGNGGNGAASPYYPSDGDGGLAATAQLHAPASVALDSAGNLYIADTGMGTLREVNAKTGIINTVTVLANSAEAALVAIDAANDIFVADGCSVFKSKGGTATPVLVAGTMECQGNGFSGNGGPAIDAQFGTVAGLFMDASGNVFLTDTDDSLVLEVSGKTGTYANSNQFSLYGVVWSPQKKLYVAVGGGGTILTSPDMVNWTVRNSNTALNLKAIAWSGTVFAAIGSGNIVVTSPDGVTWTAQKSVPGSGELLQFVSTGSSVYTDALSALKLTQPTALSLAVTGGTAYGSTTLSGYSGDLVVFVLTPTGWTDTDIQHNQQFQITENSSRQFTGSITQNTPAKALATFTVDRSGTGSITYSDGSKAAITTRLPAN